MILAGCSKKTDVMPESTEAPTAERNIVPKTVMKQNIAKGRFLTSFKFVERVSVRECHED